MCYWKYSVLFFRSYVTARRKEKRPDRANNFFMRFEIFMAATLKIAIFWDVTQCSLAVRYELSSVTLVSDLQEQLDINRTSQNWPPVYLKTKNKTFQNWPPVYLKAKNRTFHNWTSVYLKTKNRSSQNWPPVYLKTKTRTSQNWPPVCLKTKNRTFHNWPPVYLKYKNRTSQSWLPVYLKTKNFDT